MIADLTHVDTWLFDLDNTLYPAESGFMAEVTGRMTDFVQKVTGLPRDQAFRLQKDYLAEHGLTLRGLMLNHGVDPAEFHAIFHDLSLEALAQDPDLVGALSRLPGRRLVFTNADAIHAERVLARLGLAGLFEGVFHIASAGYVPKPSPEAFARMSAAHAIDPGATAFIWSVPPEEPTGFDGRTSRNTRSAPLQRATSSRRISRCRPRPRPRCSGPMHKLSKCASPAPVERMP